jgi:hypothetical protein
MSAKRSSAEHAPSWTEITLGAVLSIALGVVAGAALLTLRPVAAVKELPKEADRAPGVIYYAEGSRDSAKAKQAAVKRKLFAQGKTVSVTEDEINSFFAPAPVAPAKPKAAEKAKPGDKAAPAAAEPAKSGEMLAAGSPNFRIRDGAVQLAVPVTVSLFGLFEQQVVVLGRGGFAKRGEIFAFAPETLYVGSCPMDRLPFVGSYVSKKVFSMVPVPEDVAAAWPKLAAVSVDGNALNLAMP